MAAIPAPASPAARILVVDDEESMRHMLATVLGREGYTVATVVDGATALQAASSEPFDVVVTDVRMPGIDGMSLVQRLREAGHEAPVIVMSAYGSRELALESVRKGAFDYLDKPFTADEISVKVAMALEREKMRAELRLLKATLHTEAGPGALIGLSAAMQAIYQTIRKIGPYSSTVLVTGENGTGKELVARAIHLESPRKDRPFVAINCGAIPEALIESELFGHAKGAFTGAHAAKKGLVEEAGGGTLFLDEIGELPPPMQVKLLRLLQEGEVRRVGETRAIKTDVRVVAATSRVLPTEVQAGRFREDLFYRLNVVAVHLPPLRERREDIPALMDHFLGRLSERLHSPRKTLSGAAMARLLQHEWPGNVRELENSLESAVVLSSGPEVSVDDLPAKIRMAAPAGQDPLLKLLAPVLGQTLSVKKAADWIERELISRALERTKGNRTAAAELLDLSPRALHYKVREYHLGPDDEKKN